MKDPFSVVRDQLLRRNDLKWLSSAASDSLLLLNTGKTDSNVYILKGEASLLLWKLLADPISFESIRQHFETSFSGSAESIGRNLSQILAQLIDIGAVIKSPGPAATTTVSPNGTGRISQESASPAKTAYTDISLESHDLTKLIPGHVAIAVTALGGGSEEIAEVNCSTCLCP